MSTTDQELDIDKARMPNKPRALETVRCVNFLRDNAHRRGVIPYAEISAAVRFDVQETGHLHSAKEIVDNEDNVFWVCVRGEGYRIGDDTDRVNDSMCCLKSANKRMRRGARRVAKADPAKLPAELRVLRDIIGTQLHFGIKATSKRATTALNGNETVKISAKDIVGMMTAKK